MRTRLLSLSALAAALVLPALAQAPATVFGYYREPGGSVIEVHHCGSSAVCLRIAKLSDTAPATVDHKNPDVTLRNRPLCGLPIGTGFHLKDDAHAEDGRLYDPKSGKTYSGTMTATRDKLNLRGYVGIKAFGRSETWTRTTAPPPCS